ncbi:MAG: glutathione peroxidase [Alphaproteobacteria bacterium]|nr:glutathione peroxidase [Alphaproteobacteria bacterium]
MKKFWIALLTNFGLLTPVVYSQTSIHPLEFKDINGNTVSFSSFKGKKILIVNTASKCGYTKQYKGLETLYEKYKDKLIVVGFPCNQFLGQEPGSNQDIKNFCNKNYGVSFILGEKIDVKGKHISSVYAWLTEKKLNGVMDASISWNFNKFLIDENGFIMQHFDSGVDPLSPSIENLINK